MSIRLRAQVDPAVQKAYDKAYAAGINLMAIEEDVMRRQERATKAMILHRIHYNLENVDITIKKAQSGELTLKDVAYYWTSAREAIVEALTSKQV